MGNRKVNLGIIGGSGFNPRKFMKNVRTEEVRTPYGDVDVHIGKYKGRRVVAINRHRDGANVAAHEVNHRANMMALWIKGVNTVIATAAVGAVSEKLKPGQFVIINQHVNWGNPAITFFEGIYGVHYYDLTDPYCEFLNLALDVTADDLKLKFFEKGTYVGTTGPPFETRAEIETFQKLGYDVVGMTIVSEANLARELGMCYQPVCIVTNYGAGLTDQKLTPGEVYAMMKRKQNKIARLVFGAIIRAGRQQRRACGCCETKGPVGIFTKVIRELKKKK
jgi:5'-methylthioadenosine phosphorylase